MQQAHCANTRITIAEAVGSEWRRPKHPQSLPLLIGRKSQQLSEKGYCIKAACDSLLRQLQHVLESDKKVWTEKVGAPPGIISLFLMRTQAPLLGEATGIIPLFRLCLFSYKICCCHSLKVSGCAAVWGELRMCSQRLSWISLRMKLQDQRKLHCRPKHVFPQQFSLCL